MDVRLQYPDYRQFYKGRSGSRLTFIALERSAVMTWSECSCPDTLSLFIINVRHRFHHTGAAQLFGPSEHVGVRLVYKTVGHTLPTSTNMASSPVHFAIQKQT